ncbi:MAG: asparagine synthase (glutamine-hydrolyzing) [Bdellovibrionota bacterium]
MVDVQRGNPSAPYKINFHAWRYHFETESDSEVILKAYRAWGPAAVHQLEGMFAFALWDADHRRLWLCRDRMGIKPLYYYRSPKGGLFFSSEVRSLLALGEPWIERQIDRSALSSYFAQGSVWGSQTLVAGIRSLEPGTYSFVRQDGTMESPTPYWKLPTADHREIPSDRNTCVQNIRELLQNSLEQHLVSDVPVGLFLSGGIDSSALAILASKVQRGLDAITLGFEQTDLDESRLAKELGKKLGMHHHFIRRTEKDLLDDFPTFLEKLDQPSIDGFNTFLVSKAAREAGLKVVLSGLGADELFGGYPTFWQVPLALRLRKISNLFGPARVALAFLARQVPSMHADKMASVFVRRSHIVDLQLLRREIFVREQHLSFPQQAPTLCYTSGVDDSLVESLRGSVQGFAPETQISLIELQTYLRYVLLRDCDNFSMANSLELRVPFLSRSLLEYMIGVPGKWKRPADYPKPLLVDAVGDLPKAIYLRKKQGFHLPWAAWLRGPLRNLLLSYLEDQELWRGLGINTELPRKVWQQFESDSTSRGHASRVLALSCLASFVKTHRLSAT